MRKIETEKTMRKEERYKGVLNWFKENVPVAETELHYDNTYHPVTYTHLRTHKTHERLEKPHKLKKSK